MLVGVHLDTVVELLLYRVSHTSTQTEEPSAGSSTFV